MKSDEARAFYEALKGKKINTSAWERYEKELIDSGLGLTKESVRFYSDLKLLSSHAFLNKKIITNYYKFADRLNSETGQLINGYTFVLIIRSVEPDISFSHIYRIFSKHLMPFGRAEYYQKHRLHLLAVLIFIAYEKEQARRKKKSEKLPAFGSDIFTQHLKMVKI